MPESMKPGREDVREAYRLMLGRPPENERVVDEHVELASDLADLVKRIASSEEFSRRVGRKEASPFFHFNASVDVRSIVESHIDPARRPREGHYVNFLGVAMPIEAMPHIAERAGQLDEIPIPANHHADMAEWAAALRAVDLARDSFAMVELGCGWGCWMANTGVAAKARGLRVQVIGIEGDERHLELARQTMAANGLGEDEWKLFRGIAAARPGYALFPRREQEDWGSEPVFDVSEEESARAVATGKFDRLPMIPLADAIGALPKVDLIHMDIQGGEATLVEQSLDLLGQKAGYLVIGTHSRAIEGRLFELLLAAGWILEIERPAILMIQDGKPVTEVDGVQGWRNPRLHGG